MDGSVCIIVRIFSMATIAYAESSACLGVDYLVVALVSAIIALVSACVALVSASVALVSASVALVSASVALVSAIGVVLNAMVAQWWLDTHFWGHC